MRSGKPGRDVVECTFRDVQDEKRGVENLGGMRKVRVWGVPRSRDWIQREWDA